VDNLSIGKSRPVFFWNFSICNGQAPMMNKTIELLSKQTKKMMWTYLPRYIFGGGHPLLPVVTDPFQVVIQGVALIA